MDFMEICFWICAGCVAYAYVLYPVLLAVLAKVRPRPNRVGGFKPQSVSVIIAAHNEEATIERRLDELLEQLADAAVEGEIIVVSDGSTDATVARAAATANSLIHVLDLPTNGGKAAALTAGCAEASGEIIVFADARQTWAPWALKLLLENFADPSVGAVSGDLVIVCAPGVMSGVGFYWRFEKWLRKKESRIHSVVGVTGAISAVRRELFRPIPRGTILDDVYWPLAVAMQGYRVIHDRRAQAFDRLPDRTMDEFQRKVRTLSGNFQLLTRLPGALVPWRNPIWFQYVSHKLSRLVVPWALLTLLPLSAGLTGGIYRFAFAMQVLFYLLAFAGMWRWTGSRVRVAAAAASFLVLNSAAWLAFWVWITGKASRSWRKVPYQLPPLSYSTHS